MPFTIEDSNKAFQGLSEYSLSRRPELAEALETTKRRKTKMKISLELKPYEQEPAGKWVKYSNRPKGTPFVGSGYDQVAHLMLYDRCLFRLPSEPCPSGNMRRVLTPNDKIVICEDGTARIEWADEPKKPTIGDLPAGAVFEINGVRYIRVNEPFYTFLNLNTCGITILNKLTIPEAILGVIDCCAAEGGDDH